LGLFRSTQPFASNCFDCFSACTHNPGMKPPGLRAFALALTVARMLLPVSSVMLETADAESKKIDEIGHVSHHQEASKVATNIEGKLDGLQVEADSETAERVSLSQMAEDTQAGRRRRRGSSRSRKKSSKTSRRRRGGSSTTKTRRRRRGSGSSTTKTRRRRRGSSSGGGTKPAPAPAPPPPPATKADARPRKIEAGWGDMAKMGEFFTLFITGSGFDKEKDRALVIHGDHTCGSTSAKIATTIGTGDVPSGVNGWKSLKCNGLTSGPSKLACGNGEAGGDGVMFKDDKWVDTYKFKVCVCDFSKKNRCTSKSDFDVTPSNPTLTVNPVV